MTLSIDRLLCSPWLRRLGWLGFAVFAVKGLLWVAAGYLSNRPRWPRRS